MYVYSRTINNRIIINLMMTVINHNYMTVTIIMIVMMIIMMIMIVTMDDDSNSSRDYNHNQSQLYTSHLIITISLSHHSNIHHLKILTTYHIYIN